MCGASSAQVNLQNSQIAYYNTLTQQAQIEFGQSSKIFQDLTSTFEPILKAGPSQEGYSKAELNDLNSQAATGQGQAYATTEQAVNRQLAAGGAGLPSGVADQIRVGLAGSAAQNLSGEQLAIKQADYQQGYNNWQMAGSALSGSTGVYNPSTNAANAATGAGSAASTTANEVQQAGSQWMGLVSGALGGAAGAATSFGLGKLPSGCWIAAAIFDGWGDPRTHLVREYIFGPFAATWYGKPIAHLYTKIGERVAKSKLLVRLLSPLFHLALRRARSL